MSQVGEHHLHTRKRIYKNLEQYPHTDKLKNLFDKLAYGVAIFVVITILPQVIKIWGERNASGLSIFTWISIALGNLFWLVYGILHRERVIITANGTALLLNSLVVAGILVYGRSH